jgi:hypothetical protein
MATPSTPTIDQQSSNLSDPPSSILDGDCMPAEELLELPDLDDIQEPLSEEEFQGKPGPTLVSILTLNALHSFRTNVQLTERRAEALHIGSLHLDKYFLRNNPKAFSRRLLKDVFDTVSTRLDELFSNIVRVPIEHRYAFTLRKDYYSKIQTTLFKIKAKLSDTLLANGVPIPELPYWGTNRDLDEFVFPNDFKIFGICYRAEVERFIFIFDKHYNFQTDLPRNPNLQEPLPIPSPTQQPHRDTPPHLPTSSATTDRPKTPEDHRPSVDTLSNRRPVSPNPKRSAWYAQDLIKSRRRQSNIYHGEDGNARVSQAHRNARNTARPPTSRMREVLNNIGETFQERNTDRKQPASSASRTNHGNHQSQPDDDPSDGDDEGRDGHNPRNPTRRPEHHPRTLPQPRRTFGGGGPLDDDLSDGDGDGDNRNDWRAPQWDPQRLGNTNETPQGQEPHFDLKLKFESVPKWDGNTDTIVRWLSKVNNLARMSSTIFTQLGAVVPHRLEGTAETWYWSLPIDYRDSIEKNWDTLRNCISSYYMNRKWLDKQKARAIRAYYREPGNTCESPSNYYIRKSELLNMVYTMDDSEIILEVMEGAPPSWNTILMTQMYLDVVEFQSAIRFHEDTLMKLDSSMGNSYRRECFDAPQRDYNGFRETRNQYNTRANLVGATKSLPPPSFPKDDSNLTQRTTTPEEKGARPCQHCGSRKHWDNECKYVFKSNCSARVNHTSTTEDALQAQRDYDNLYYDLDSSNEEFTKAQQEQDFCNSLQTPDQSSRSIGSNGTTSRDASSLEGNLGASNTQSFKTNTSSKFPQTQEASNGSGVRSFKVNTNIRTPSQPTTPKPPLNQCSHQRLARNIAVSSYFLQDNCQEAPSSGKLVELRKLMARPPGCTFLGSRATQTTATVGGVDLDPIKVIVNSGSDITLISQETLEGLLTKPKIRAGQKINLIQVTRTSSISGFATLDLFFKTGEGPVKMNVEAYIIKGMSTPFILGNDFSLQYSLSVLREDMTTRIQLGNSGCYVQAEESPSSSPINGQGHTFKVKIRSPTSTTIPRNRAHSKNQKFRKRMQGSEARSEVRSLHRIIIPPETSKVIPVKAFFPGNTDTLFVEQHLGSLNNADDVFGSADSFITKDNLFLHIVNFSKSPVVISEGQLMGTSRNPNTWLDKEKTFSTVERAKIDTHCSLIKSLMEARLPDSSLANTKTVTSETEISSKAQ